jgi:hypothetical protein
MMTLVCLFFTLVLSINPDEGTAGGELRSIRQRALQRAEKKIALVDPLDILNSNFGAVADRLAESDILKLCRGECQKYGKHYNVKTDECE